MDVAGKKRVKRDWPAVFAEFQRSGMTIKRTCVCLSQQAGQHAQAIVLGSRWLCDLV